MGIIETTKSNTTGATFFQSLKLIAPVTIAAQLHTQIKYLTAYLHEHF